ncbi:MAG: tetratricopeptide repeat protein [Leptospiraceae bacterium]|nr:tetratricopeptide repeat protein [Leptospiraceae bacterium]
MGRFLTRNKQYEDAIDYLNQYNVLKPYNADAYTILAVCEFRIGNIEKAYDELKRSLSLRNDNPSALYNLVKVQMALGQNNEAHSSFAALEFLRPNHPRVQALKKKMEQI